MPNAECLMSKASKRARRTSVASEPRERSEPAKRRARERVGESEGQSPSDETSEAQMMNRTLRVLPATALATLVATSVQAQINNSPPGGNGPTGRGRGPGVEASVVTNARSPEVNADNTI